MHHGVHLKRKTLLIFRNRVKKRATTAASDHSNAVAEELPREWPVLAVDPILISSADELSVVASTQHAADVTTIKPPVGLSAVDNVELKNLSTQGMEFLWVV